MNIISELNGFGKEYYILENGNIMCVMSEKAWSKVAELENENNEICVRLILEDNSVGLFKKEDILNGVIEPISNSNLKIGKSEKRVQMLKDGIVINTFLNANIASVETGVAYSGIYNCCIKRKYSKSAGGYEWQYEN